VIRVAVAIGARIGVLPNAFRLPFAAGRYSTKGPARGRDGPFDVAIGARSGVSPTLSGCPAASRDGAKVRHEGQTFVLAGSAAAEPARRRDLLPPQPGWLWRRSRGSQLSSQRS